jgi:hypothetical protein
VVATGALSALASPSASPSDWAPSSGRDGPPGDAVTAQGEGCDAHGGHPAAPSNLATATLPPRPTPNPGANGGTPGYTVQLMHVHCDGLAYNGHSDRVGEAKIQCAQRELHGRTPTDLTCVPHHRPLQGTGAMPLGLLPQAHQLGEGHQRPPGCPVPLDFAGPVSLEPVTQAPLLPPPAMGRLPPSEPPRNRRWRGVGVRASPGARPPRRPRDSQGASGHAQGQRCLECRAHPEHQLLAGIRSWTTRWNAGLGERQDAAREGGSSKVGHALHATWNNVSHGGLRSARSARQAPCSHALTSCLTLGP